MRRHRQHSSRRFTHSEQCILCSHSLVVGSVGRFASVSWQNAINFNFLDVNPNKRHFGGRITHHTFGILIFVSFFRSFVGYSRICLRCQKCKSHEKRSHVSVLKFLIFVEAKADARCPSFVFALEFTIYCRCTMHAADLSKAFCKWISQIDVSAVCDSLRRPFTASAPATNFAFRMDIDLLFVGWRRNEQFALSIFASRHTRSTRILDTRFEVDVMYAVGGRPHWIWIFYLTFESKQTGRTSVCLIHRP